MPLYISKEQVVNFVQGVTFAKFQNSCPSVWIPMFCIRVQDPALESGAQGPALGSGVQGPSWGSGVLFFRYAF